MSLPSSLSLTSIDNGSSLASAPVRDNFTDIQTTVNDVITAAGGGGGEIHGHEYAYTEFTSNASITATTEGTADTVVTASAVTFDGSTVAMVQFFAPQVKPPSAATAAVVLWLYQDGSSIGALGTVETPAANVLEVPVWVARRLTPASGSRTYSIRASVGSGTGTVVAGAGGAGANVPGFIRITKV